MSQSTRPIINTSTPPCRTSTAPLTYSIAKMAATAVMCPAHRRWPLRRPRVLIPAVALCPRRQPRPQRVRRAVSHARRVPLPMPSSVHAVWQYGTQSKKLNINKQSHYPPATSRLRGSGKALRCPTDMTYCVSENCHVRSTGFIKAAYAAATHAAPTLLPRSQPSCYPPPALRL